MTRWQKIRQQVLERDGYTCQNCGYKNEDLDVHHIIPRRLGGLDVVNNLVSLCSDKCHWLLEYRSHNTETQEHQKMVKLKDSTHAELVKIGRYGETMDDIIKKCVKAYKESHGNL